MAHQTDRILELDRLIQHTFYTGDIISRSDYETERKELQEQLNCVDECPHCGSEINVSDWDDVQSSGVMNCHACDRSYNYEAEHIVTFTTSTSKK